MEFPHVNCINFRVSRRTFKLMFTMRDSVLWIVFFLLILCHQSHSSCETLVKDLCLDQDIKNWTKASESCDLGVSNTSLTVGVPIEEIPNLKPRSRILSWIGATGKFTPWFELIGCHPSFYDPNEPKLMSNSNIGPIAECHQICEKWNKWYKEFGINETHCFCRDEPKENPFQNKTCKFQKFKGFEKDLIGTDVDTGIAKKFTGIAVYRKRSVITNIGTVDDTFGECMLETFEGNKTHPCDSADGTGDTWAKRHQAKISDDSLPRWTSYVRRLIISWMTGSCAVQDATVCIGVSNQNGFYEPSPRRCNETHTSICKIATITKERAELPDSTLPLIIGSAVGGLLCIVILVIIIVIFIKRRRRPNKKENSHPAPTENFYYSEMKEDRKSIEKEEPSPTVDSTDYDIMMSVNKEKITDDSEEYGKLLPFDDADLYTHTWDKPITEQLTDHVYSSTISGNDVNVYDHTATSNTELTEDSEEKRSILNGMEDNLYDHTDTNDTELT